MHHLFKVAMLTIALFHVSAFAQETAPGMVKTYDALADTILAIKRTEVGFVRAMLESYMDAARMDYENRDYEGAAANMALFANEGDNAIAGIRKRLVDGGHHHHHHASDEDTADYDQGFVIVDKANKASLLASAAQMRQAKKKTAKAAWSNFEDTAKGLLAAE